MNPPRRLKGIPRPGAWLSALVGLSALILVRALELRLPLLAIPLWQDEFRHNIPVLEASSWADLAGKVRFLRQPLLDFWLRRAFWFPLFGWSEVALRLPTLTYGCLTPLAAFFLSAAQLRRHAPGDRQGDATAALGALGCALWTLHHPLQLWASIEARNYSLVALCSVLWFSAFLWGKSPRTLLGFGVLFANTHFFSLPLIGAGHAWRAWRARARTRAALGELAALGAICLVTALLNAPALREAILSPPMEIVGPRLGAMGRTLGSLQELLSFLSWPLPLGLYALMLALAWRPDGRERGGLAVLALASCATIGLARARSMATFEQRYFLPYTGLAFAVLVQAGSAALTLARRPKTRAFLAAAGCFALPGLVLGLVLDARELSWPAPNFTPLYLAHQRLMATGRPLFVYTGPCWLDVVPRFYLQYGPQGPFRAPAELACSDDPAPDRTRRHLSAFLARHRDGIVVLEAVRRRSSCEGSPSEMRIGRALVHRSPFACVWAVEGAASREEIEEVENRIAFGELLRLRNSRPPVL